MNPQTEAPARTYQIVIALVMTLYLLCDELAIYIQGTEVGISAQQQSLRIRHLNSDNCAFHSGKT
ncbi:hypothetical protein KLPMCK396B_25620 [Klebsiella pneumoniae]